MRALSQKSTPLCLCTDRYISRELGEGGIEQRGSRSEFGAEGSIQLALGVKLADSAEADPVPVDGIAGVVALGDGLAVSFVAVCGGL